MDGIEPRQWEVERYDRIVGLSFRGRPGFALLCAFVFVSLLMVGSAVFAAGNIGDDGYLFDPGCAEQGRECNFSRGYSLRFGHDGRWSFLGDLGPGAVRCPVSVSGDSASACWYYNDGIAPAGAGRASQGVDGAEGSGAQPPQSASDIDWSSTSHLLQALCVCAMAFALVTGYRAGDKR